MSTGTSTVDILAAYDLQPLGDLSFRAPNARSTHGVVFGGQLLGQALLAATTASEGKQIRTLHAVFARAARPDADVEIDVAPVHEGRTFGTVMVTIRQGDRKCLQAQALLDVDEPDLIRHQSPAPEATAPPIDPNAPDEWLVDIGGVDISDPALVGPPQLDAWTRFGGVPEGTSQARHRALLAFATDGFLIGTAMRPHEGVGQAQAHRTLSTGVISHTITFHEPVDAGAWNLLSHHSPYSGHGRSFGAAEVFCNGALVASFFQDAMIRPRTDGGAL